MTKILIVDDEPAIVAGIEALLELHGISSEGVWDCDTAEARMAGEFFPVILADLRLSSEADGLRLLDAIRRMSPRSRVASMTGYADAGTEQRLRERGAHCVLLKPLLEDDLIGVLREMLLAVEAGESPAGSDEELYASTVGTLRAITSRRFGLDREDVDDLVQDTWLLYLEKRASVRTPKAWLSGAVVNLCRQRIGRRIRERDRFGELVEPGAQPPVDTVLSVQQALGRLDERSRALCTLLGLEQRTYEEVSETLELPIGSVGPLYMRAKDRLRRAMAG